MSSLSVELMLSFLCVFQNKNFNVPQCLLIQKSDAILFFANFILSKLLCHVKFKNIYDSVTLLGDLNGQIHCSYWLNGHRQPMHGNTLYRLLGLPALNTFIYSISQEHMSCTIYFIKFTSKSVQ